MVLGEFYMIAVNEYDSGSANNKQVAYRNITGIDKHIEKYLLSFSAINGRNDIADCHYKYERVCLLIVDFNHAIPKIYHTDDELRADGLLPEGSVASINNLSFTNFIAELLQTYNERFGEGKFI